MATHEATVEYIVGQMAGAGQIYARKMFGEYGVWCGRKTVALICNEKLFVKLTLQGRALAEGAAEVPPYPGAKPSLLIDSDRWDDKEWLTKLICVTAAALPEPRPKRKKLQ